MLGPGSADLLWPGICRKENKVEKLTLRCRNLETPMGKVVKELMENYMNIDLKPHIIENKVVYFYLDTYGTAA